MIEKNKIQQLFRDLLRKERGQQDRQPMHPVREWGVGLLAVTVLVVVGGGVSFFMYTTTTAELVGDVSATVPPVPYQAAVVDAANAKYEARRSDYEAVMKKEIVAPEVSATPTPVVVEPVATSTSEVEVTPTEPALDEPTRSF